MITDSIPWKEELGRVADRLEKRQVQVRWTDRTSYLVERDVMVAAFSVRKLHEARKISDELVSKPVTVWQCQARNQGPDIWTRVEPWAHYDLENREAKSLSLINFCNQIIHSWNWMLSATETRPHRFDGIFISSDFDRRKAVYFVSVDVLVNVFRAVDSDDVLSWEMRADENGERQITRVLARPPDCPRESEKDPRLKRADPGTMATCGLPRRAVRDGSPKGHTLMPRSVRSETHASAAMRPWKSWRVSHAA